MAPQFINGDISAFIQDEESIFNSSTGYLYRASFKGVNVALMEQVQLSAVAGGQNCSFKIWKGGTATLEVEDPTQQYAIDVWEVVEENLNVDLFSMPDFLEVISAYTNGPDIIAAIRDNLAANNGYDQFPTAQGEIMDTLSSSDDAYIGALYSLYQRGTTDKRLFNYILRHTANVPSRDWTWPGGTSYFDYQVNSIYSNSSLLTEVGLSVWALPLPPLFVQKLGIIAAAAPSDITEAAANGNTWQWGWLKGGSNATTAANNRVNVTQDYVAALWSNTLYGARV